MPLSTTSGERVAADWLAGWLADLHELLDRIGAHCRRLLQRHRRYGLSAAALGLICRAKRSQKTTYDKAPAFGAAAALGSLRQQV